MKTSTAAAIALLASCLHLSTRAEAIMVVGNGFACTHQTLQDAIDMGALSPGPDEIRLTATAQYREISAKIANQDLTIVGGYATCASDGPNDITLLDGRGGTARSVLEIRGSGVVHLKRVGFVNGDEGSTSDGGGIDYKGYGSLILNFVYLYNNRAGYGGGLSFRGEGAGATLALLDNVTLQSNHAVHNGGGLHLSGRAKLQMSGANSFFAFNTAFGAVGPDQSIVDGYGGGLYVKAPATADIGAGGVLGTGVVFYANEAHRGGGAAILGNEDGHANNVRFYSAFAAAPLRMTENRAGDRGGGIYARATLRSFGGASVPDVCVFDTSMEANTAPRGAAVFIGGDETYFGFAMGGAKYAQNIHCARPADAATCNRGLLCNEIVGNLAQTLDGEPTDGGVIEFDAHTVAWGIRGINLHHNRAQSLIKSGSSRALTLEFHNSLIWRNTVSDYLVDVPDWGLTMHHNTVVDNAVESNLLFRMQLDQANFKSGAIRNSIIDQPFAAFGEIEGEDEDFEASHVFSNAEFFNLPPGQMRYVSTEPPGFADRGAADFRLRASAPAIDYAPMYGDGLSHDAMGQPRNVDRAEPNLSGIRDAGALEAQ